MEVKMSEKFIIFSISSYIKFVAHIFHYISPFFIIYIDYYRNIFICIIVSLLEKV